MTRCSMCGRKDCCGADYEDELEALRARNADLEAKLIELSRQEPVFVITAAQHGPGEDFVEIETDAGKGVRILSIPHRRGRKIGPLYTNPVPPAVPDYMVREAEAIATGHPSKDARVFARFCLEMWTAQNQEGE